MPPQETKTRTKEDVLDEIKYYLIKGGVDPARCMYLHAKFKEALEEYAQAYANERFEKAMVEEISSGYILRGHLARSTHALGYNDCRSEIIARWNKLK